MARKKNTAPVVEESTQLVEEASEEERAQEEALIDESIAAEAAEAAHAEALHADYVADEKASTYTVMRLSRYCVGGSIYTLAAGSVVSEKTHDIDELVLQGVPLERSE